jgi:hypothetical protein
MSDPPPEPGVDARLRDYLANELRQAEFDFPHLSRPEQMAVRRWPPVGVLAVVVAMLLLVVVVPRFLGSVFEGTGGTPMGADGLPISINGEPVLRGMAIATRLGSGGGSFLAGGTLVLDTRPCVSRSARAQIGCGDGWELVAGPAAEPTATFVLDGAPSAAGFVRTSGASTVARVHRWPSSSGQGRGEILVVEALVWRQPTKGPIPASATPAEGGTTNDALVPDFVSAWDRDGVSIAGYIPKRYLLEAPRVTPGSPSDPPEGLALPVYGDDLITLVGHMVPGVGFVALGSVITAGPSDSVAPASVAPSPAESVPPASASAGASRMPAATVECGRISPAACAEAIGVARAGHEAEVARAARIVVDDTCSPTVVCDRLYPFDSVVVFVTAGADTTGWYAFHVVGLDYNAPTEAEPWLGDLPAHVAQRLMEPQPQP